MIRLLRKIILINIPHIKIETVKNSLFVRFQMEFFDLPGLDRQIYIVSVIDYQFES